MLHNVSIHYCCDMFRPYFLAIFKELVSLCGFCANWLKFYKGLTDAVLSPTPPPWPSPRSIYLFFLILKD